ncbi:MAG: hypothetical protein AAB719_00835 [Patescibacteria group bacterium]
MKKEIVVIIALVAAGFILFTGTKSFQLNNPEASSPSPISLPAFLFPTLEAPTADRATVGSEAWQTLQNYLTFAKNHDLSGVKSLSHQISPTCADPLREKECFALMDSIYSLAGELDPRIFKFIQNDNKQVVMYTDGPVVLIIYFTRSENRILKVLGLRACVEMQGGDPCVEPDTLKNDEDKDGWWDTVETLFYNN